MFTFDMPRNPSKEVKPKAEEKEVQQPEAKKEEPAQEKKIIHTLSEDDVQEEVEKPKELSIKAQNTHNGITRYSLDDYMQVEEMLKSSQPVHKPKPEPKPEPQPELKKPVTPTPPPAPAPVPEPVAKATPKPEEAKSAPDEEVDPFNSPINESLVKRAAERRAKMKEFNYKFRNNQSKVDEFEKQPAYKRRGIELDNSKPGEEKLSRTTIGNGDDDELRFRSNNSFLHDNVD